MLIHKRNKKTGEDAILTVEQFLADIPEALGDTTKHKKLESLAALVDGRFCQNLKVAYYIPSAISKSATEHLAENKSKAETHATALAQEPGDKRRV